jgi:hypothetical protein
MRIEPFRPEHLETLILQPQQERARAFLANPDYGKALANGLAYAAIDDDGTVLCCAGLLPMWEGRAEAWALMGGNLKRHFLAIHHAALRFLSVAEFRRIEAVVDAQFCTGHKWLERLGFKPEGLREAYTPDGRDCIGYAKVRR